ncbi:hypothetical protein QLH52_23120 [Methylomonas sp. OY6]|uniref:Uncharacterized protein n=2 Tax=Methylococcaceae TaxID=403 RepID=A0ABU4UL26_9GAMM|nr:hypothetical protein [Methylomonas sp. OY6]
MAKTMSWHRITLSRQEYESGEIYVLLGAFRAAYVARNGPEGMAMFGGWSDDETAFLVYTTPRSVRHITPILDAYSAKQSKIPDPSGLSLIYGDESGFSSFEMGFEA